MITELTPLTFSAQGDVRDRLAPKTLLVPIAEVGRGLASSETQLKPLTLHAPEIKLYIDPWLLWEHLGDFACVDDPRYSLVFKIPDPVDMVPVLESGRAEWLSLMRATPKQIQAAISGGEHLSAEELSVSAKKSAAAYLTMLNVMLLYVRKRWNLLPDPPDGVLAGLFEEMGLFTALLPKKGLRHPASQEALERFAVEVERLTGRQLPNVGQRLGPIVRHGGRARELYDSERIKWYVMLPNYIEMRALRRNRYNYVALVFTENRVAVDTAQKENRVFLWRGPLADVLSAIDSALSGSAIKETMERHRLCVAAHEHDEEGLDAVRQFLA